MFPLWKKLLLSLQYIMAHISGKNARTEENATFPSSVGHIFQDKKDIQISKTGSAHVQFCFSATIKRLQLNYHLTLSNMQ